MPQLPNNLLVDYLHWHEKETVPFFETAHEVTVLENHHPQFYQRGAYH